VDSIFFKVKIRLIICSEGLGLWLGRSPNHGPNPETAPKEGVSPSRASITYSAAAHGSADGSLRGNQG